MTRILLAILAAIISGCVFAQEPKNVQPGPTPSSGSTTTIEANIGFDIQAPSTWNVKVNNRNTFAMFLSPSRTVITALVLPCIEPCKRAPHPEKVAEATALLDKLFSEGASPTTSHIKEIGFRKLGPYTVKYDRVKTEIGKHQITQIQEQYYFYKYDQELTITVTYRAEDYLRDAPIVQSVLDTFEIVE